MNIKIITHYGKNDIECTGDYWEIDLVIDDKSHFYFGDDYHERGMDKVEGFLRAAKYFVGYDINIEREEVADME